MLQKYELLLLYAIAFGSEIILVVQNSSIIAELIHGGVDDTEDAADESVVVFVLEYLQEVDNPVYFEEPENAHPF